MNPTNNVLSAFLLYSAPDRAFVQIIHSKLIEIGVQPWMDTNRIIAGNDWEREIFTALRNSSLVLIFISHASVDRHSFFQKEVKYALDRASETPEGELFIIPIRLDNCPIPNVLTIYQYVDFSKSMEKGWKELLRAINAKQKSLGLSLSPKTKFETKTEPLQNAKPESDVEGEMNNLLPNLFSNAKTTNEIIKSIFHIADSLISKRSGDIEGIAASQIQLLTGYYSLVLNQAQRSFTWALIWAFIGVSSFVVAGIFLLVNDLNNIAYISAIGGALVEIISGINFYLYNKAAAQLAEFHSRLDSTQRILLANTMCEKIEGDLKQETRSQLALAYAGINPQLSVAEKERPVPLIRITKVNSNPEGRDVENEFIEISNLGDEAVDMTAWKLSDKADHEFTFSRYCLHPRQSVSIWTKIGKDTESDLFWNKGVPIWNNTQDCAYLKNNNGVLIDFFCYVADQKAG